MQHPDWSQDVFFQYPLSRFATSAGEIDLPILCCDCSVVMALFQVDVDKAADVVRDPDLTVVPVVGGLRLTVSESSLHPMAERLRAMGLDGVKPVCVSRSDRLQLRLNAGRPLRPPNLCCARL